LRKLSKRNIFAENREMGHKNNNNQCHGKNCHICGKLFERKITQFFVSFLVVFMVYMGG
jgi:hypothetical protein